MFGDWAQDVMIVLWIHNHRRELLLANRNFVTFVLNILHLIPKIILFSADCSDKYLHVIIEGISSKLFSTLKYSS